MNGNRDTSIQIGWGIWIERAEKDDQYDCMKEA